MRAPIWRLEWRLALRRRRLFLLNTTIPLLLVVPIAVGRAPAFHAAAAYAVLFVLFGTFGSAIPLLRDAEGGILRRLILTGTAGSRLLGERALAGSAMDTLQLAPAIAVILLAGEAGAPLWALAPPVLFLTLVAANLVGIWVAALARSLAEGALFAAVVSLFLLHGSGVFRTALPGTVGAAFQDVLPFGALHRTLLAGAGGAPDPGFQPSILIPGAGAFLLLGVTLGFAPRLLERIAPPVR